MTALEWIEQAMALLATLWAVLSALVALTPTKADDAALERLLNRASFLKPRNVPGILSRPGRLERSPAKE